MDVLRMAFSNDRDLAVLCRPMQPKVEATPFTDRGDTSPKIKMHTLKLVSDVKSSGVYDSQVIMYMISNSTWAWCLLSYVEDFLLLRLEEAVAHGMLRLLFIAVMLRRKAISMLRTNRKSEILLAVRTKSL